MSTNPELIDSAQAPAEERALGPRLEPESIPPLPAAAPGLLQPVPVKGIKTAEELAAMILNDLRQLNGCPRDGVNVTVYGSNPWNTWLSFTGAAGPLRNKAEFQEFCDILTERLKRLYEIG